MLYSSCKCGQFRIYDPARLSPSQPVRHYLDGCFKNKESKTMNAKEANQMASEVRPKLFSKELERLETAIMTAASQGEFEIEVGGHISMDNIAYLQNQGYRIYGDSYDDGIIIYWDEV